MDLNLTSLDDLESAHHVVCDILRAASAAQVAGRSELSRRLVNDAAAVLEHVAVAHEAPWSFTGAN